MGPVESASTIGPHGEKHTHKSFLSQKGKRLEDEHSDYCTKGKLSIVGGWVCTYVSLRLLVKTQTMVDLDVMMIGFWF